MTSSLVGSEMCIRDSCYRPVATIDPRQPRVTTQVAVLLRVPPLFWSPVSYTHLTLPTICSV
eukprot:1391475-Prorocentrum_lima.AAC.1